MKPLLARSCNWVFNSLNSAGDILYDGIEMGADLDNNSIPNSNSQSGGWPDKSSRNTSWNSRTTSTLSKVTFEEDLSTTCARYASHPLCSNLFASKAEITHVGKTLRSPSNSHSGYPSFWNTTVLVKQSTEAQWVDNQSIPKITSKSFRIKFSFKTTLSTKTSQTLKIILRKIYSPKVS